MLSDRISVAHSYLIQFVKHFPCSAMETKAQISEDTKIKKAGSGFKYDIDGMISLLFLSFF